MKILVIGVSARGAVQSGLRAGHDMVALDLFNDRDLSAVAPCERIQKFPDSIIAQAKRWPKHAILLCGGMENYPEIVAELGLRHRIVGPNADQIRMLRDRKKWSAWIGESDCQALIRSPSTQKERPEATRHAISADADDRWLWKGDKSGGGTSIRWAADVESVSNQQGYWQQYIPGFSIGVTCECSSAEVNILGIARNLLLGERGGPLPSELRGAPFQYAGSLGPIEIDSIHNAAMKDLVQRVAIDVGYHGLLQLDWILGSDGILYFLECNPRWTASMELIEWCRGINLFQHQLDLQSDSSHLPSLRFDRPLDFQFLALKRIVYATQSGTFSQESSHAMMLNTDPFHAIRTSGKALCGWLDVPPPGTSILAGMPISTAWAVRRPSQSNSVLNDADWPEITDLCRATLPDGSYV